VRVRGCGVSRAGTVRALPVSPGTGCRSVATPPGAGGERYH
jgi:hypothetical protein